MLCELSVRNIVLIDHLNINFSQGLTVLTGETGAGKSILLDSLSLVLGVRGRADLVRSGQPEGHVSALFNIRSTPGLTDRLREHNIDVTHDEILIRRVQSADGRSKAYINDTPVSLPLLRSAGHELVEIHGQHDARALIDPSTHLDLLDNFGALIDLRKTVEASWDHWRAIERDIETRNNNLLTLERDRAYIEHSLEELNALSPEVGEEEKLAESRHNMMKSEEVAKALDQCLSFLGGPHSPATELGAMVKNLSRYSADLPESLDEGLDALGKAIDHFYGAEQALSQARDKASFDPFELEAIEERLFGLRALARKHRVTADELPALLERFSHQLSELQNHDHDLERLQQDLSKARDDYFSQADLLSEARATAAHDLESGVAAELPALKLGQARFYVERRSDREQAHRHGYDQIAFHVQTNPGARGGPIGKVASGGELSRFTLALKVVLAARIGAPTLIFDEVDTGVGGAVADAIGERLARLADHSQVLTVTHAPQVAVKANHHWLIRKDVPDKHDNLPVTRINALDMAEKQEEVARMLAGAEITDEARAAAVRLMAGTLS